MITWGSVNHGVDLNFWVNYALKAFPPVNIKIKYIIECIFVSRNSFEAVVIVQFKRLNNQVCPEFWLLHNILF